MTYTAWEELQAERRKGPITFLCPVITEFFQPRGILEVYGSSGAGKSTLAMQFMVKHLQHRPGCKALYLCTDNQFSIQRLDDLCSDLEGPEYAELLGRIIVQHLGDLETQDHFISYFLEPLVAREYVNCVILDTVTSNYRVEPRNPRVTTSLYSMARRLNTISSNHRAVVISLNQVTDDFTSEGSVKPALGLSWSNSITSRAFLRRHVSKPSRILDIERCPFISRVCVELSLGRLGFQEPQEIKQIA